MKRGKFALTSFYCTKCQVVENNHNRILPKGSVLTQEVLDLCILPHQFLGGKTPYETFAFFYGEEMLEIKLRKMMS